MEEKQQVVQTGSQVETSPPTLELSSEELASLDSISDFSPINYQQHDLHNFYDVVNPPPLRNNNNAAAVIITVKR